jgi:hypothetical protein
MLRDHSMSTRLVTRMFTPRYGPRTNASSCVCCCCCCCHKLVRPLWRAASTAGEACISCGLYILFKCVYSGEAGAKCTRTHIQTTHSSRAQGSSKRKNSIIKQQWNGHKYIMLFSHSTMQECDTMNQSHVQEQCLVVLTHG